MQLPPNHTIIIRVMDDGSTEARVQGVNGDQCMGLLDLLDEAGIVLLEEKTDDYDKPSQQGIQPSSTVSSGW